MSAARKAKPAELTWQLASRIRQYWRRGFDTATIAKHTGLTEAAVYNFLAKRREG